MLSILGTLSKNGSTLIPIVSHFNKFKFTVSLFSCLMFISCLPPITVNNLLIQSSVSKFSPDNFIDSACFAPISAEAKRNCESNVASCVLLTYY